MTASPDDTLTELDAISRELDALGAATVEAPELVHRAERAVAFAIAWLSPSPSHAAPALEAAVAGAAPRATAPRALDLRLTVDVLANALRRALAQVTDPC